MERLFTAFRMTFVGEAFRLPRAGKPRLYIIVGTLTSTVPYGIVLMGWKDSSLSLRMTFAGSLCRKQKRLAFRRAFDILF